jgi:predicted ATP-grasp superfamily ATP-dependent carboligase
LIFAMPSFLHVSLSERVSLPKPGAAILIAAPSGRALASAARRAGYRPLVADFFDDEDTRALAEANRLVAGDLECGFKSEALIASLEALAEARMPAGIVYGAGFEDRAGLLEDLALRWKVFGNRPEVVRNVKDPVALAALCATLNIKHPEISVTMPQVDAKDWLVKSVGGAGGSHVAPAETWRPADEKVYFQRLAPGDPVSILFLADGAKAHVLGASRQWPMPAPDEPFRFGGSLRPADLSSKLNERLTELAKAMARACGLRGLNSIDLLLDGDAFTLIEINPRPGATLDIFEDRDGLLFQAHLDGCLGRLPERPLRFDGAAAAGIAYARRPIASMPALDWPDWTSDRQKPQTALRSHDPLCTVRARAAKPSRARVLMDERTAFILDKIDHLGTGATS